MNRMPRRAVAALTTLVAAALLTACSDAGGQPTPAAPVTTASDGHAHSHDDVSSGSPLPGEHVHGVAIDPGDGRVYLATHEGLFLRDGSGWTSVGPVIDLMGFTAAGPGHFYASGHPGAGVDLPNPVGLIESTDAGETWQPLSRQGVSDFHAMTASQEGVVAFDGSRLESTGDGTTWRPLPVPVPPFAMGVSPDGATLVVTSESGPVRSTDGGAQWEKIADVPLLQVVAWADDDTVVGVTPDGVVAVSEDRGATWEQKAEVEGPPQALAAVRASDGSLRVVVITQGGALESRDLDAGFAPLSDG
ncbi:exo-alpha-sialidase [Cellulomonas septica]|uniref:Exo-alpha-sialidase n=1 Tax=Cellulomonas septica TaxID=285080 RepID=A0ABX1JW25_9CELL|nr:exo-alpha-sialidase [Cellulomonas septica]NKY38026.1 exo-alpha-sialidase [Cellulomonas septica]